MAQPGSGQSFLSGMSLKTLPRDMFSGSVAAVVTIAYAVSFSALIFSGPLEAGLGFGFVALLIGAAITGLIVGLFTRLVPADAGPDTPAVAVMSVLALAVGQRFLANGDGELAVLHVLVAISLATMLTGLFLFALGALKAGQWLRFIPYPVIGGFLAASGWLLVAGGVDVIVKTPIAGIATLGGVVVDRWPQLATGIGMALAILALRRRVGTYILLPGAFFAGVIIVNLGLWLAAALGPPVDSAPWFLDASASRSVWWPASAIFDARIQWGVLVRQSVEIAAVCGVTAIALLLDISSLEMARSKAVDLDHELRVNGAANVVAAALGGIAGNLSMVGSLLISEAGAVSRLATLTASLVCTIAIFAGSWLLTAIPTPVLGGVLIYLGISILYHALIESAGQRSMADNVLAIAIAVTIVASGYLIGILLGVLGACVSFVLSYSRISVIRQHLSRANFSSNTDRSPDNMRLLSQDGEKIQILWLRGYIFFGTSNRLFEYMRRKFWGEDAPRVHFIILDFAQVPGFDSSAIFSLIKLRNACRDHDAVLVLSGLSDSLRGFLDNVGFFPPGDDRTVLCIAHRDDALQWCEDQLLDAHGTADPRDTEFRRWLAAQLGGARLADRVIAYLDRVEVKSGDLVVKQGSVSNSIELIASGRMVVSLKGSHGKATRLHQIDGQTIVGEMGFYRRAKRTASVIAEEDAVVYRLDRKSFDKMTRTDPEAATALNGFIIRMLSDRLDFAIREIAALQ